MAPGGVKPGRTGCRCAASRVWANILVVETSPLRATTGDLIAVTDAGVRLDPDWLCHLQHRFTPEDGRRERVLYGRPAQSTFERALGATTLPSVDDVRAEQSYRRVGRSCFDVGAWGRVGGYPEWLDYCEDLVFDLALPPRRLSPRLRLGRYRPLSAAAVAGGVLSGILCVRAWRREGGAVAAAACDPLRDILCWRCSWSLGGDAGRGCSDGGAVSYAAPTLRAADLSGLPAKRTAGGVL